MNRWATERVRYTNHGVVGSIFEDKKLAGKDPADIWCGVETRRNGFEWLIKAIGRSGGSRQAPSRQNQVACGNTWVTHAIVEMWHSCSSAEKRTIALLSWPECAHMNDEVWAEIGVKEANKDVLYLLDWNCKWSQIDCPVLSGARRTMQWNTRLRVESMEVRLSDTCCDMYGRGGT